MHRPLSLPQTPTAADLKRIAGMYQVVELQTRLHEAMTEILRSWGEAYKGGEPPPDSPAGVVALRGHDTRSAVYLKFSATSKIDENAIRRYVPSFAYLRRTAFVEVAFTQAEFPSAADFTVMHVAAARLGATIPIDIDRHYPDGSCLPALERAVTRMDAQLGRAVPIVSLDEDSSDRVLRSTAIGRRDWLGRVSRFWLPAQFNEVQWLGPGPVMPVGLADALGETRSRFLFHDGRLVLAYGPSPAGEFYLFTSSEHGSAAVGRCAGLINEVEALGPSPLGRLQLGRYKSPRDKSSRIYRIFMATLLLACHWQHWSEPPHPTTTARTAT
jgi:hypothetical protein